MLYPPAVTLPLWGCSALEGMTELAYPLTQTNGVDQMPGKLTVFCLPKQRAQLALGYQFYDLMRSVKAVFFDLPRSH